MICPWAVAGKWFDSLGRAENGKTFLVEFSLDLILAVEVVSSLAGYNDETVRGAPCRATSVLFL